MYYAEYKALCEADGLNSDNLLSLLELEQAKERAYDMAKVKKRLDNSDWISDNVREGMEKWKKLQDEKRMEHMITALEMAESIDGLGNNWDLFLKNKWKSWKREIPKI